MAFFFRKNKSKSKYSTLAPKPRFSLKDSRKNKGKVSINQNRSPYTQKLSFFKTKRKARLKSFGNLNSALTPPARLKQSGLSKVKKVLITILVFLIIFSGIYWIFFTDYFQISEYKIYEDDIQITTNLKLNDIVSQSLQKQNIFLFNQELLDQQILDQFPEYSTATVNILLPHTIRVDLTRFPVTANIIDEIQSPDGGPKVVKKFIVNSNGMIIQENDENPDLPYLRVTSDQVFALGQYPLDKDILDYTVKLVNLFEEKFGIRVTEAQMLLKAREIHLVTEKNFTVWFDSMQDINSQIDKLKRALVKLDIYNTPLEYIDLRINGVDSEKVIYKTRNK